MTAPATPAPAAPTHPCARCGDPVALDTGLCERCNPLGLKDSASSQAHGTVFLGIGLAIAGLAIAASLAVSGIGPFRAQVTAMRPGSTAGAVIATIEVRNEGRSTGSATCRLTDADDPGLTHSAVVYSPRVAGGATATFEHEVDFGSVDQLLVVSCTGP